MLTDSKLRNLQPRDEFHKEKARFKDVETFGAWAEKWLPWLRKLAQTVWVSDCRQASA